MNWHTLNNENQLEEIKQMSHNHPIMIFKHSTSCSISATSLGRIERSWNEDGAKGLKPYYLDLIRYRQISNKIANDFGIEHESPQVLLIQGEKCIYDASHFDIRFDEITKQIAEA